MKMTTGALLFTLLTVIGGSCSRPAEQPATQQVDAATKPAPQFAHADVQLILDDASQVVNSTKRVDQAAADRLAAFFPGLGTGRKSRKAGAWIANVKIQFYRPDGTVLVVTSNYQDWNQGPSGDLPVNGDLRGHISKMFAP